MLIERTIGLALTGFLMAFVFVLVGAGIYLKWGHPPVATEDTAFPMEAQIVHVPLRTRMSREVEPPPFDGSKQVYEAGAAVYKQNCATWMYPTAPQLFKKNAKGNAVGVSNDPPSRTFWKVKNGIRLTGMPSFQHTLSADQMWDVTLLLKASDQPLSTAVYEQLKK